MNQITPDSLRYGQIPESSVVERSWQEVPPVSGTTFSANGNIEFNINSSSQFLNLADSYIRYDMVLTGGTLASAGNISYNNSLASVIKESLLEYGGVQVERVDNYNNLVALKIKEDTSSNKNILKLTEAYSAGNVLTATSDKFTYGRQACHQLKSAFGKTSTELPLPFTRGGLRVALRLATVEEILAEAGAGGSDSTNFSITNVRFLARMVTPSPQYMKEAQDELSKNNLLRIPIKINKTITYTPTADLTQNKTMAVGYLGSLDKVALVHRTASTLTTKSTDAFAHKNADLLEAFFQVGSQRYPKNTPIYCNNATGAVKSPEQFMQRIVDCEWACDFSDNIDSNLNSGLVYNFQKTKGLKSGIALEDGQIIVNARYKSDPSSFTVDMFVEASGTILVSLNDLIIDLKS